MAGISDLLGPNGVVEQLMLWQVIGQVVSVLASPAFTALQQDVQQQHPEIVLTPEILATATARHLVTDAAARTEAAKSGVNASRFELLHQMATIRLSPADLAEAVLRSYMTPAEAQAEAAPQGWDAHRLAILSDLAGDAPGPDQLTAALRRGIIKRLGTGPNSTSYEQGIAETRLHNKWGPVLEALSEQVLPPADAASAVVRNFMSDADGRRIAAESGIPAGTFEILRHLAGDAPGPQQLAEALRRGVIPEVGTGAGSVSFEQGIAEGRLADKWAPVIKALAHIWPTPVQALDALLKGQVTHAQGLALYEKLGGDPQFFELLFNTQGSAPTPLELIEMANRGYIPWDGTGAGIVSYEQGFREGPWRDKWAPVYRKFAEYLPPESTVRTLLAHGAISQHEAGILLARQGMSESLITAFLDEAHTEALSDYRGASVQMTLDSYAARIISKEDATTILISLHVSGSAVELLLAYTDIKRAFAAVGNALARVRTLFAARKITVQTAEQALHTLNVPAASIPGIMAAWELENSISVKTLTEAQITAAWEIHVFTDKEALTELENIGYTPFDAWALLSVKAKTPLPGKPAVGPALPQSQVIAGTT
jgi:hypothetical protein